MFDHATLSSFASSMIARARVESVDQSADLPIPCGRSYDDLHSAAVAQSDKTKALSLRVNAELKVVLASLERVERENSVLRGRVDHLIEIDKARRAEFQRALQDAKDVAEACAKEFVELMTLRGSLRA